MIKSLLIPLFILFFSLSGRASVYLGGSYGYSMFSSDALDKYKVAPKGMTYGGFVGIGKDFVGLEFIYQNLATTGKLKHEDIAYDLKSNATALGGALRFSFNLLYLRLGLARYSLDQSVTGADATTELAIRQIYDLEEKGTVKNGALYGFGIHGKIFSTRVFIDYTRYQIYSVGTYDTISAGFAFTLPDKIMNLGTSDFSK